MPDEVVQTPGRPMASERLDGPRRGLRASLAWFAAPAAGPARIGPAALIYGAEEAPPTLVARVSAIQHVA